MVSRTKTVDEHLVRRRCVECGYDGALLRDGRAPLCARCGCDLRRRPARSYLEMEGFLPAPVPRDRHHAPVGPEPDNGMLRRWIAFLFLATLGLAMLIYLSAAAFSV